MPNKPPELRVDFGRLLYHDVQIFTNLISHRITLRLWVEPTYRVLCGLSCWCSTAHIVADQKSLKIRPN